MRNKPITVTLFANAYDNELKTNPHSKLKEGTYSVDNDRISFLTKKRGRISVKFKYSAY